MTECTRPWLANVPLTQLAGASLSSWRRGICAYPAHIYAATCIRTDTCLHAEYVGTIRERVEAATYTMHPRAAACMRARKQVRVRSSDRISQTYLPIHRTSVHYEHTIKPYSMPRLPHGFAPIHFLPPLPSLQHESVSRRHWNSPWSFFSLFLLTPFLSLFLINADIYLSMKLYLHVVCK